MGSLSSSAPTVVCTEVCRNWPAIATIGPRPHGSVMARRRLAAASAGAIGAPRSSRAVTSARPGGFTWSNPSDVRSIRSCQSRIDSLMVSVFAGLSLMVCGPSPMRRTCGPLPRSTATTVGCAGSSEALGVSRRALTVVGAGRCTVRLAPFRNWTMPCGATQAVRGSPSVAA
ncbi:Uncharacterised protein [Mycobacteroides abscessus subsp. abscessus]|nr:Uncharacterised protein [Mycobacteroides abscessus subsp. abscessus]